MTTTAKPLVMVTWEGTSPIIMARLVDDTDGNVVQSGIAASEGILYYVYNAKTGAVVTAETELARADVIYDTLQTGNGWSVDSEGYNFRWKIPVASLPNAAQSITYRVEIVFTSSGSDADKTILVVEIGRINLISQAAS